MRKLVNIRGTNGSGKTTIPLGMMALSQDWEQITFTTDAGIKSHLTLLHDLKWVMLGKYDGVKTGGMDTLKNTQTVKETLFKAIDDYEDYNILMEGILCSTVRSTYIDLFSDIAKEYGIEIVIVGLTTPLEVCLDRIQQRNGGKPINEELVAQKLKTVEKGLPYFKQAGFRLFRVDTSKYSKDKTVQLFLKNMGG